LRWIVGEGKLAEKAIVKISARNQFKGTILEVVKGATTSHVRIDIGGGAVVTASMRDNGGLVTASPEQILVWAPDTIFTLDRSFRQSVAEKPA
jgi:molybdopterin-binding protein